MVIEIAGHPDYAITDSGEVISYKRHDYPRTLLPDYSNGYPRVNLDGERRYLADLVAEYFLPLPKHPSCKVFYIDGDKTNCCASNLIWLMPSEIQMYSHYTVEYRMEVLGEWA